MSLFRSQIRTQESPAWRSASVHLAPWLALAGWVLLVWLSRHPPRALVWWLLAVLGAHWLLALLVWREPSPGQSRQWLLWGVVFRVIGLLALPILEDDHFRFLWDGRTFALTGNPYASTPSEHFGENTGEFESILDQINYPHVPTIYGPILETGFLVSYWVAPAALWPWKLLLLAADVVLLLMLRQFDKTVGSRAALFAAWCPLSIFETAFNAHPDALAVSLLTGALLARQSNRDRWLGFLCGAAVSAKIFALLLVPFLLWRRRWISVAWAIVTTLVCYAPFWLQGSLSEFPGLQTFAREWEFNSSGYALLAAVLRPELARTLAGFLFVTCWLWIFWRWSRSADARDALPPAFVVFVLFFLLSPVFNPWYALWLLPFVALRPTLGGVTVLVAVSLSYVTQHNLGAGVADGFAHPIWLRVAEFGLIALALVTQIWWRREPVPRAIL